MARKQQVIHLHNTTKKGDLNALKGAGMVVGELAMYNASSEKDAELYILNADGSKIVPFVSKDYVDAVDKKFDDFSTTNEIAQEFVNLKNEIVGKEPFVSGATSGSTTVAGAKAYTDAKIAALNYSGVTERTDADVLIDVTETDGVISATTAALNVSATTTDASTTYSFMLNGKQVGSSIVVDKSAEGNAKKYTDDEIAKLDYTGLTNVHVVTNVTETNGVVSATGAQFSVEDSTVGTTKTHKLKLGDTVVAQWENDVNTFLDTVVLSGETLVFTWNTGSGKNKTEVDISTFFSKAEAQSLAGKGLSGDTTNGKIDITKATIASNSDNDFLVIAEDGIGLSGITKMVTDKLDNYYTENEADDTFAPKAWGVSGVTDTTGNDGIDITFANNTLSAVASTSHKAAHITGATGDTYVEASFANNKVTVKATDTLKNGITAASSAVQKVKVYTDANGTATEKSGTTIDLTTMVIDCGTY